MRGAESNLRPYRDRIENVSTEMSLHVLAYNLKRVTQVLGIAKTMKAMKLAGG